MAIKIKKEGRKEGRRKTFAHAAFVDWVGRRKPR